MKARVINLKEVNPNLEIEKIKENIVREFKHSYLEDFQNESNPKNFEYNETISRNLKPKENLNEQIK